MKKLAFAAVLGLFALVGCQPKGYKISGEVAGNESDSVQVFLSERINRVWQTIDSVMVVGGKFKMQGEVDSVRVINLYVKYKDPSKDRMEPFVFENGAIKVKVDSAGIVVSGTKQNDDFTLYKKEKHRNEIAIDSVYESYMKLSDTERTKAAEDSVGKIINGMYEDIIKKDVDYSMRHTNTVIGTHVFLSSFYGYTIEQKEALFAKMDAKTRAVPRVAELIAAAEVEKKTSAGQPYVNFTLTSPDGKRVSLADFVGKTDYILIDFWASWCGPCIRSFPELTAFYAKNKGRKFEIIGVSLDKEKKEWTSAIQKHKLAWKHVSDLKYWECEGAKLYAVNSIPATVLIDKHGKIAGRNMKLEEIQNLLNQQVTK